MSKLRAAVKKFLPLWKERLVSKGVEVVKSELENEGKTKYLDRKDRMQLLRELGLR